MRETFPDHDAREAEALEQFSAALEARQDLPHTREIERQMVDIPALRGRHGMTQEDFAAAIGISVGTLRNWEQGRRTPEGPAQRLLMIIDARPDVAFEILSATHMMNAPSESAENIDDLVARLFQSDDDKVLAYGAPNTHLRRTTHFEAEAYILTKEEGGRHKPFFANYRPQFYFRTTDVTGKVELPEGTEMVMPGETVSFTVELVQPIAMEERLRFAIREGGRTIGAGVVSKIID